MKKREQFGWIAFVLVLLAGVFATASEADAEWYWHCGRRYWRNEHYAPHEFHDAQEKFEWKVGEYLRDKALRDKIMRYTAQELADRFEEGEKVDGEPADEAAERAEYEEWRRRRRAGGGNIPDEGSPPDDPSTGETTPPVPDGDIPPPPDAPMDPTGTQEGDPDFAKVREATQKVVDAACVRCHGPNKQSGGLRLDDLKVLEDKLAAMETQAKEDRLSVILTKVDLGIMPPDPAPKLAGEDFAWVRLWVAGQLR